MDNSHVKLIREIISLLQPQGRPDDNLKFEKFETEEDGRSTLRRLTLNTWVENGGERKRDGYLIITLRRDNA